MKVEKTRKYLRNYPYEVEEELAELERLAKIGRYTEMALEHYYFDGYQSDRQIQSTDELIAWGEEQEANNA